jgi:hypothetical protein
MHNQPVYPLCKHARHDVEIWQIMRAVVAAKNNDPKRCILIKVLEKRYFLVIGGGKFAYFLRALIYNQH